MLMMLVLWFAKSVQSGSSCCGCRGFNGGEIGQRAGKHIQVMLVMLALRFKKSVHASGRLAAAATGSTEGKSDRELQRKSRDADDARAAFQ